jgi:hypothetical protein
MPKPFITKGKWLLTARPGKDFDKASMEVLYPCALDGGTKESIALTSPIISNCFVHGKGYQVYGEILWRAAEGVAGFPGFLDFNGLRAGGSCIGSVR